MTPRQRLKELLHSAALYTLPESLDSLLNDASAEITGLREKLHRQSTMLAEALRAKNNLHEELSRLLKVVPYQYTINHSPVEAVCDYLRIMKSDLEHKTEELNGLRTKVDEDTKKAALYSLLENYYDCPGEVGAFINKLRAEICQKNVELTATKEDLARKLGVIDLLNGELARLRPPEPKFRTGQVVVCLKHGPDRKDYAVKIEEATFLDYSKVWCYKDSCERVWEERDLRGLLDAEK